MAQSPGGQTARQVCSSAQQGTDVPATTPTHLPKVICVLPVVQVFVLQRGRESERRCIPEAASP